MSSKITSLENYVSHSSHNTVLVGGCFDILHIGHIRFLNNARAQGDYLIVVLEPDEFIKTKKGRTPFHTQKERAEVLAALSMVDEIVLIPRLYVSNDYKDLVLNIRPNIIAVSEGDPSMANKSAFSALVNGSIKIVTSHIHHKSTSDILKDQY